MISRIFYLFVVVFFFSTCKKGENDPGFTLRTRTNRLTGEWNMTTGRASYTWKPFSIMYTLNHSDVTLYETYTGGIPTIYKGSYNLNLNITKDGKFNFRETLQNWKLEASGSWKFLPKSGDKKNKECVQFTIDQVARGTIHGTNLFNQHNTIFTYSIDELRKDKLVLHAAGTVDFNGSVNYTNDYNFFQSEN